MRSEPLDLAHKETLFESLRRVETSISEYSFANLYLFRRVHQYEVLFDGEIFVKGVTYDGHSYVMPSTDPAGIDIVRLREAMGTVDFLFPVDERWLPLFDPGEFEVSFNDGDSDYLYTVEKMKTFPGRRLHKKRNLLYQFEKNYRREAFPLTKDRMGDARYILDVWQTENVGGSGETDFEACAEALDLYDELVLCGGIYYANDEPAGFIIGEEVNAETFVLHFAKGITRYKGIYQYIFKNFAGLLPGTYRYINLEQDLNRENLRTTKSSYLPDVMQKKMRVAPRRR